MDIQLRAMSKELARRYHSQFVMDPALYMDISKFQTYVYSDERSDTTYERHMQLGRIYLAIMLDSEPIGEIILKHIDHENRHCTLSICMQSDTYKNKGYGTKAEILALQYAFSELEMNTVFADSILTNKRSQHVLQKVGFKETHRDDTFIYYRCDKATWTYPDLE